MAKQEEIKEGVAEWLWENRAGETTVQDWVDTWDELSKQRKEAFRELAGKFMAYLHSQGIKLSDGSSLISK